MVALKAEIYTERWKECVSKMQEERIPKQVLNYQLIGRRSVGRTRIIWRSWNRQNCLTLEGHKKKSVVCAVPIIKKKNIHNIKEYKEFCNIIILASIPGTLLYF